MVGAYGELKEAGRLDSRQGRGTWVRASDAPPSGERPFSAELYSGLLHQDDDMIELTAACPPPTSVVGRVLGEMSGEALAQEVHAARSRVPVVEDLALRRMGMDDRPLPAPIAAHAPEAVISIGSVSKVLWAGLRIGWIRAPHAVVERLTRLKIAADMGTSVLSQHLAARLLPSIEEATEERRRHLIEGYDALSGALSEHLPEWTWDRPRGGCTLWVRLPSGDARAFGQVAQRCGVNVVPGPVLSAEGGTATGCASRSCTSRRSSPRPCAAWPRPGTSMRGAAPGWSGRRASSCDGSGAQTVSRPSSTVSARPASPTRAPQAST